MNYWATIKTLFLKALARYLVDREGLRYETLRAQAVDVEEGDLVVVRSERRLSGEQAAMLRSHLVRAGFPEGVQVLVLDAGMDLQVYRRAQDGAVVTLPADVFDRLYDSARAFGISEEDDAVAEAALGAQQ